MSDVCNNTKNMIVMNRTYSNDMKLADNETIFNTQTEKTRVKKEFILSFFINIRILEIIIYFQLAITMLG